MTKVKKYWWVALIIVLVVLITIYFIFFYNVPPKDFYVTLEYPNINVYEDIEIKDLIKNSNAEFENQKLDTSTVGNNSMKLKYKYKNRHYTFNYTYSVTDSIEPKIFGSGTKTVDLNYDGDLCNLITFADNFDRELTCKIEGDYDLTKEGSYKIKFIITDDYENSSNHNLTLNVKKPSSNNGSSTSKKENLMFADAIKDYKTDDLEIGIDVSKWQEDIDFTKVKAAGASFVMIRIGGKTEIGDDIFTDSYFAENIKKAKKAGLKVGIYFYSKAASVSDAKKEAKWIIKKLDKEKLDLPICFDWENWSSWRSFKLNFYDLNNMAKTFISEVEKAGYKGMLYSSKFYLENFWFDEDYENIWLAHYTTKTSYENYDIWQLSNIGKIEGIKGDVDIDVMTKSFLENDEG